MTELKNQPSTRDDGAYWDDLAARVTDHATRHGTRRDTVGIFLGSGSGWLAASCLIGAAATLLFVVGAAERSAGAFSGGTMQLPDQMGQSIAEAEAPPAIGVLLLSATRTGAAP